MAKVITHKLNWDTGKGETFPVFVREVQGGAHGPTLALIAGEHGMETVGPAAIDAVCRDLERKSFAGTVLAVPTIAPVNIRYRYHPEGKQPTAGYVPYAWHLKWPGDPDGDPADRLCALVWREVIEQADAIYNFHAWGSAPCALTYPGVDGVKEFARDFGIPFRSYSFRRPLLTAAMEMGKPAVTVELQGHYVIDPRSFQRCRRGIYNIMTSLGMLDHPIEREKPQFVVGDEEAVVKAPAAGLFVPVTSIESMVKAGDLLGYLLDVHTGTRVDVLSPIDGAVWLLTRLGPHSQSYAESSHEYADEGDVIALIKQIHEMDEYLYAQ